MKHVLFGAATAMLAAMTAQAGEYCLLDDSEIFTCTFKGGTHVVELCDVKWLDGDQASYGYVDRRDGTVEKEIIRDKASLTAHPWNGIGRSIYESVTFHTVDGYGYEVFWSADRIDDTETGGIHVHRGSEVIATLTCDPDSLEQRLWHLIEQVGQAQLSP